MFEPLEPRLLLSADPIVGAIQTPESPVVNAAPLPVLSAGVLDNAASISLSAQQQPGRTPDVIAAQMQPRREVVFVDAQVDGHEKFLEDALNQNNSDRRIEVRILDPARDGIEQISETLGHYRNLDAVHFISHGTDAAVQLGATWLDSETLKIMRHSIAGWASSLSAEADLLFYGCDLAASPHGVAFIEEVSRLTGAEVAASTNLTGARDLGGDWDLEYRAGQIETALAFSSELRAQWINLLATYESFSNYTSELEIKSDANHGQTFRHNSGNGTYTVNEVSLALRRASDASAQTLTITLRDSWNGPILGSTTISSSTLGTSLTWHDLDIGNVTLNDDQAYTIRVSSNTTNGKVYAGFNPSGGYTGGTRLDVSGAPIFAEDVAFKVGFSGTNIAPTATNLNAAETYMEDTPLDLTDIVITDIDSPNVTARLTLSDPAAGSLNTGTSGAVTSTYDAASGVWTASGATADVNALMAGLTFTPTLNYNSNFSIATSVDDGTDPPITGVKNITGIAVNDAPTASNMSAPETYVLLTPLDLADIVVADVDSTNVTVTLTLSDPSAGSLSTGTSGSVTSTYSAGTGVWTASGAIADVNVLLASLIYNPTLLPLFPFTIATNVDDGVAPAITGSKSMTLGLLNLPPLATNLNAAETYTEDTPLDLTNIVITDLDSPNATVTLTLSDPAAGSLNTGSSGAVTSTYNAGAGIWRASGAIADINALLAGLTFTPALNHNGNFAIATSVSDGMAAPITGAKNLTGIPVNDAPTATNLNVTETYNEETSLNLTGIVVNDVDSAAVTVRLTLSDAAAGTLSTGTSGLVTSTYNALTGIWTASGAIANVNALLANITFTPSVDYSSNFTIASSIDDGVAAPVTGVKNMIAAGVNDAPSATNLNAPETYTEDTPLNLGGIVVNDVDSATVTVTLTLSDATAGTLSTGTSGTVTSTYNSATGIWTASGAIADVNALLANITFTPSPNYNSNFTIATSVSDGVAVPITGVKSMTAAAVNDGPVLLSNTLTLSESGSVGLSSGNLSASDPDNAGGSLTFTVSAVGSGRFELVSNPGVAITSFTQAQLAAGVIRFVHDGSEAAPSYEVTVSDSDLSDGPVAAAITFTNVNDAPVLMNNRLDITQGDSVVLTGANFSATDVDNSHTGLVFSISRVTAGRFELVSNPGVAITSFTQAQLAAGVIRFVHDGSAAAPSYEVTVSDGNLSYGPLAAAVTFAGLQPRTLPIPLPTEPVQPGQPPMERPILDSGGSVPPDVANPSSGPAPIPEDKTSVSSSAGPDPDRGGVGREEHPQNESESPLNAIEADNDISLITATAKTLYRPTSQIPAPLHRSEGLLIGEKAETEESVGRSTSGDTTAVTGAQSFIQDIDKLRDEVTQQTYLEKIAVGSTLAATTGLSIGYVLWLLRGEVLLTSLLASLPAWRMVDPLPVLASLNRRSDEDQQDDDSIEAAINKGSDVRVALPPSTQSGARSVKWRMVIEPADSAMENNL